MLQQEKNKKIKKVLCVTVSGKKYLKIEHVKYFNVESSCIRKQTPKTQS